MAGSHSSEEGSDSGQQPPGSFALPTTTTPQTAASSALPTSTAPLPISTAPPATSPLNLTVTPLGAAFSDGASSSTAPPPPPSIHAVNINAHIDFKLDPVAGNYSKWRRIMSFILRKSGVESHVLVNLDPLEQTAQWRHDDLQILLIIYGTISDELYDVISAKDSTAYHAWFLLDAFFRDNLAGRAVHVGAEFRATVQGDLRIGEYCRRLKALADTLDDLDEHISDKTLTLQMIRGLSPRFQTMASLLPMQVPFPTFVQARSRLMLEEISQDARAQAAGGTALVATHGGSSPGSTNPGGDRSAGGDRTPPAPTGGNTQRQDRGGRGGRGGRGRGGRGRGNGGRAPPTPHTLQQPWMGYFAPWGSPFPPAGRAPWIPPNAAGVLGPRPGVPHQAYPMMYGAPPSYGATPPPPPYAAPPTPSWDQAGMLNAAMANMSLQQPGAAGEWYLDTGASSHITNNAGSGEQDPSHEVK